MKITAGVIMFCVGAAGSLISLILLPVLGKIFQKQRKNLMKKLEKEV